MKRREFIKKCGGVGITCLGLTVLLDSCKSVHHITGNVINDKVKINKLEFVIPSGKEPSYRKYIIARVDSLLFPIVIYRYAEDNYKALLLRCTHQNYELNVNGDLISCSAHGSEFNKIGDVVSGPAEESLESFLVTTDEKNIYLKIKQ